MTAGRLEEGAFYAWTPEQAERATGDRGDRRAHSACELPRRSRRARSRIWRPSVEIDFAALDPQLENLRQARGRRQRPLRDDKIIAGWNGLMIRALAEGAAAFDAPDYARMAARGGRCALVTAVGRHAPRAPLGRWPARARLARSRTMPGWGLAASPWPSLTGQALWRDRALALADAIEDHFADGSGRLRMAAADGPLGPIYDSADGATPSGESSALEFLARFACRCDGHEIEARARALAAALSPMLAEQPLLRPDALAAARVLQSGETGRRRVLGRGVVRVQLCPDRLVLDIGDGWHVNAPNAAGELVGLVLDGAEASWPEGRSVRLGFADAPVAVYEGRLEVPLRAPPSGLVRLRLQACSDRRCLAPETATFRLP